MFHFGKKKASVPELVLSAENIELYKDPQPCYIHRGAARQYLVAKLTDMITNGTPDFALLEEYTGIEPIDHAELTKD